MTAELARDGHRRHAILIANQEYPEGSGFPALKCPFNDAAALENVLADPECGGFDTLVKVMDRDRRDILIELRRFFQQADRDDLVFIYFSGRGKPDEDGDLYFAARNTDSGFLSETGIDARDIAEMVRKSAVQKRRLSLTAAMRVPSSRASSPTPPQSRTRSPRSRAAAALTS